VSKSKCCVIFINQIRMKIGVMFGSPETTCVVPETMVEYYVDSQ
jgi:RecA/RadA recombinase